MISIVMPIYNAERYLRQALVSIFSQTFTDYEIVAVDDGSTDLSLNILESFKTDPRLKIYHTKNSGAPHARNTGLFHARGAFIIFFDADDIMFPDLLKNLYFMSCGKSNPADLAIATLRSFSGDHFAEGTGEVASELGVIREYDMGSIQDATVVSCLTPFPGVKLYNAEVIKNNGIQFDDVRIGQDLNFFLKYLACIKTVRVSTKVLCAYRVTPGSISHKADKKILDIAESLRYAEEFGIRKNKSDAYLVALANAKIKHFSIQLGKYPFIKNKNIRNHVFEELTHAMLTVSETKVQLTRFSEKRIRVVKIKRVLKPVILHQPYLAFYRMSHQSIMR